MRIAKKYYITETRILSPVFGFQICSQNCSLNFVFKVANLPLNGWLDKEVSFVCVKQRQVSNCSCLNSADRVIFLASGSIACVGVDAYTARLYQINSHIQVVPHLQRRPNCDSFLGVFNFNLHYDVIIPAMLKKNI